MTDKTKYSNISVSKETYSELKRLSRKLLPGETPLSISKTVTVLANCKIKSLDNYTSSNIRDSRDKNNNLNYLSGDKKFKEIEECEVINVKDNKRELVKLKDLM